MNYFDPIKSDIENIRRRKNSDPKISEIYNITNRYEWPIHKMIETYNRVFPTFPGVYTQLDLETYNDITWPWVGSGPGESLKEDYLCEQQ